MLCSAHTPSFLKGTGMTATSIVPKNLWPGNRNPSVIWKFWKCINLSYFLFVNFIGVTTLFWLEEVLSTSSPFPSHITSPAPKPSLHCLNLHLSEVKNSSWSCFVCRLLYYFRLLVVIKAQMRIYQFSKGGWVLWEPALQRKLLSALMPWGLKNSLSGFPTDYNSVLSRCRMQDFSLWRIP